MPISQMDCLYNLGAEKVMKTTMRWIYRIICRSVGRRGLLKESEKIHGIALVPVLERASFKHVIVFIHKEGNPVT